MKGYLVLLIIAPIITGSVCYAMANHSIDNLENSTNRTISENSANPTIEGGIIPGNPQKASETGNSDITRNTEVLPVKPSGI